jgi:hypothetical protein
MRRFGELNAACDVFQELVFEGKYLKIEENNIIIENILNYRHFYYLLFQFDCLLGIKMNISRSYIF